MAPQCPGKEYSRWTCIRPCPGRTCCLFLCKAGPTLLLCPAAPSSQAQNGHPSPPPGSLHCPFWGPPDSVPPLPYPDSLPGGQLSPALLPLDGGLLAKHVPSESGSQPPCSPAQSHHLPWVDSLPGLQEGRKEEPGCWGWEDSSGGRWGNGLGMGGWRNPGSNPDCCFLGLKTCASVSMFPQMDTSTVMQGWREVHRTQAKGQAIAATQSLCSENRTRPDPSGDQAPC